MTTLEQAARQALEALHGFIPYLPLSDKAQCGRYDESITALRQAFKQPKQEPVAWLTEAAWGTDVSLEKPDFGKSEWKAPAPKVTALYPTLPIREWQNLTEAEIRDIRKRNQSHDAFAHAIENKLKEKNT